MTTNNPPNVLGHASDLSLSASRPQHFNLSRSARAFQGALWIAILVCWSPFNALGYVAPLLVTGWYILFSGKQKAIRNVVFWIMAWLLVICLYVCINFSIDFAIQSALITMITYSAFVVLPTISGKDIAESGLWHKALNGLQWVVLVEGLWGITQAVYGFSLLGSFSGVNGDYVEGTLHPALAPELAMSNPMFAINMAFMLLALAPSVILKRKYLPAFLIGSTAFVLANVLHVLYLLVVALFVAFVLYFPSLLRSKVGLLFVSFCVLIVIISVTVTGLQTDLAQRLFSVNLAGETPRGVVLHNAFESMPSEYPLMPLIGIGPGQFSSRAGLIGTGYYFGRTERPRTLPFLAPSMSPAFRKYVLDAWLYNPAPRYLASSTTQPYFSWLSIYVEFGGITLAGIALLVAFFMVQLKYYAKNTALRIHAVAVGAGILLLFLLGIQENYWEIPQAILIGLLLLKLEFAHLRGLSREYLALRRIVP